MPIALDVVKSVWYGVKQQDGTLSVRPAVVFRADTLPDGEVQADLLVFLRGHRDNGIEANGKSPEHANLSAGTWPVFEARLSRDKIEPGCFMLADKVYPLPGEGVPPPDDE